MDSKTFHCPFFKVFLYVTLIWLIKLSLDTFTCNAQIELILHQESKPNNLSYINVYLSLIKQLKFCAERRNRSFVACDFYRETLLQSKGCWKLTYDFSLLQYNYCFVWDFSALHSWRNVLISKFTDILLSLIVFLNR